MTSSSNNEIQATETAPEPAKPKPVKKARARKPAAKPVKASPFQGTAITKAELVRQNPSLTAKQLVELARKKHGLVINEKYVFTTRRRARKALAKANPPKPAPNPMSARKTPPRAATTQEAQELRSLIVRYGLEGARQMLESAAAEMLGSRK